MSRAEIGICSDSAMGDPDEHLIMLVRQYEHLYNYSVKGHRDSQIRDKSWSAIGSTLNRSTEDVKSRWSKLRDRYVQNKRENKEIKESSGKDWMLKQNMSFIDPYIHFRKISKTTPADIYSSPKPIPQVQVINIKEIPSPSSTPSNYECPRYPASPSVSSPPSPSVAIKVHSPPEFKERVDVPCRKRARVEDADSGISEVESLEVDHFSKFMMSKLKGLKERARSEAMLYIHQYLHRLTYSTEK